MPPSSSWATSSSPCSSAGHEPSGNRIQVVQYNQIQFTKTDRVLAGMNLELGKSESALEELRAKDLAD
jgi:hypothetical protein